MRWAHYDDCGGLEGGARQGSRWGLILGDSSPKKMVVEGRAREFGSRGIVHRLDHVGRPCG